MPNKMKAKLKEVLTDYCHNQSNSEEAIDQIYRVFKNDGWTRLVDNEHNLLILKTGKEWYELFRHELHDMIVNLATNVHDDAREFYIARKAARKAAG